MTDLLLHDREQAAVRAIIALEPAPGTSLPGEGLLHHVRRLIACDVVGVSLLDDHGYVVRELTTPGGPASSYSQARRGPVTARVPWVEGPSGRGVTRPGLATRSGPRPGLDGLELVVRNGTDHVVQLWIVRSACPFSQRDRALLALVAPALERLLGERPEPAMPSFLTIQEQRVLRQVALGLSNADIAERMYIAPCTVRKHLENAYRKLGVTNRLAAVNLLENRV